MILSTSFVYFSYFCINTRTTIYVYFQCVFSFPVVTGSTGGCDNKQGDTILLCQVHSYEYHRYTRTSISVFFVPRMVGFTGKINGV